MDSTKNEVTLTVDFGWAGGKFVVRKDMSLTKDRSQAATFSKQRAEALKNHLLLLGFDSVRVELG